MKRHFLIALLAIFSFTVSLAQSSMTDDQVMQYVISEHAKGVSQAQILKSLIEQGVDINQIRRIRAKYEKEIQSQSMGAVADNAVEEADKVMRQNNGTSKRTTTTAAATSTLTTPQQPSTTTPSTLTPSTLTPQDAMDPALMGLLSEENPQEPTTPNAFSEMLYKGNKVFGRDIFNNPELTFEPVMNIATPQDYIVGPGDNIKVDIYGASQKSNVYTVSPDGEITVDGYGPISVSGLTISQANARLRSTLGSRYSSSTIKASLGQSRTILVNVMGEVRTPGTFTLSAFASVFHALYMAGGTNEIGTLRNIKVYRQGRLINTVDVYDFILNGKQKGNIRLADGDVIVVGPFDCMVNITGKVKRPMYYEMKSSESVSTLLNYAGGYESDAYTKSMRVVRNNGNRKSVYNVNEFDLSSFKVADGDEVSVDSILDRYENMVEVKGAVFRPGLYHLGGDITTVRALLEQCDGVTEDAFTARGVMHRMKSDRTLEVISVDVDGILNGTTPDITLRNEDVLFIPTRQESQTERTVTIHGEVQYPGMYKYADNITLEDIVLQAGGLKETASTVKVDVARRIYDAKATTTDSLIAHTYSFALKDGFVVDGEQGFVLKPYDEVYVRRSPGYSTQQNVTITGEVNFPGEYTLNKRETRLSDIIKAAGGITATGYIKGARLERTITDEERLRMNQILNMTKSQSGDKDSINTAQLDLGSKYYVGIQLDKAMEEPGSDYDLVLREKDRIIVPEYNNTVKISGDVLYPNTVAYKKGKKAKYYVALAGGFGQRAKKSHTYIVHMNGTVSQMGKGERPTPGSEIIVPTKPKADASQLSQWLAIGTSTASIATMLATIANLLE